MNINEKLAKTAELETLAMKLANWRWPEATKVSIGWDYELNARMMTIYLQDETVVTRLFPHDLTACFEWLKPAVIDRGTTTSSILTWRTVLHNWLRTMAIEKAMDDEPALALCKAIEQLIDEEQHGN